MSAFLSNKRLKISSFPLSTEAWTGLRYLCDIHFIIIGSVWCKWHWSPWRKTLVYILSHVEPDGDLLHISGLDGRVKAERHEEKHLLRDCLPGNWGYRLGVLWTVVSLWGNILWGAVRRLWPSLGRTGGLGICRGFSWLRKSLGTAANNRERHFQKI